MDILFASTNKGKVEDFKKTIQMNYPSVNVVSLTDVGLDGVDIEETGTTYLENAIIKAEYVSKLISDYIIIGDDSGLEIKALDGAPGLYSSRFLGHDTSYIEKISKIHEMMKDETDRECHYICQLYAICGDKTFEAHGYLYGEVNHEISGTKGFGYDPMVYLKEYNCNVSEITDEIRYKELARSKAIKELMAKLNEAGLLG